jgi:hypothetical protein
MHDQRQECRQPELRKPYTAPRLEEFGTVRDLTAGGSSGNTEVLRCSKYASESRRC